MRASSSPPGCEPSLGVKSRDVGPRRDLDGAHLEDRRVPDQHARARVRRTMLAASLGSSAVVRRPMYVPSPVFVMEPLRTRFAAWLCLALVLLTGLTPAQGFVVCIEEDWCVSIELKAADANCGGCEGHEESNAPVQAAATSGDDPCPCIDLAVPNSPEQQLSQSRSIELHIGPWIAPPPEIRVQHATPTVTAGRGPPPCIPRVADSWEHIRTVVLLV
jgi:hypothetical protein